MHFLKTRMFLIASTSFLATTSKPLSAGIFDLEDMTKNSLKQFIYKQPQFDFNLEEFLFAQNNQDKSEQLFHYGNLLLQKNETEASITMADSIQFMEPNNVNWAFLKANAYQKKQDWGKSAEALEHIINSSPDIDEKTDALYQLIQLYQDKNIDNPKKIEKIYTRLKIDLPPRASLIFVEDYLAPQQLASIESKQSLPQDFVLLQLYPFMESSKQMFSKFREHFPIETKTLDGFLRISICMNKGFSEKAREFLTEYFTNALRAKRSRDYLNTVDHLLSCRLDWDFSAILERLNQIATNSSISSFDRTRSAIRTSRILKRKNLGDVSIHYLQNWLETEKVSSHQHIIWDEIADIYEADNQFEHALSHYNKALKKGRSSNLYKWKIFWTHIRAKEYQKALDLLNANRFFKMKDRSFPEGKIFWKARLYDRLNQPEKSEVEWTKLKKDYPFSPYLHLTPANHAKPIYNLDNRDRITKGHLNPDNYPIKYSETLEEISEIMDLDPFLILSLMKRESRFEPFATSWVGARGLMQIMPKTFYHLLVKLSLPTELFPRIYEPKINIFLGASYLQMLLNYYQGRVPLALAGYNAGPVAVDRWIKGCPECSLDEFVEGIPFRETRNYVKYVMQNYISYSVLYRNKSFTTGPNSLPTSIAQNQDLF